MAVEDVAAALGLRFVRRCSRFWSRVDAGQVDRLAAELADRRAAELLAPPERAAYAGVAAFRVIDLVSHHRPELLRRAIRWCEAHLAPWWR